MSSQGKLDNILSGFIDPANKEMDFENFWNLLLDAAFPERNGESPSEDQEFLIKVLRENILGSVKDARRFNATYMGHLLSEPSIPALLSYILALRVGSNTVSREVSIFETELEPSVMQWLMQIVGFDPNEASGTFTSGGTLANITALAVARKVMEARSPASRKYRVLVSPYAHYSIPKACDLLGGPNHDIELIRIKPHKFRMSTEDLIEKIQEAQSVYVPIMAIVAIAGETETGLIDPLDEIASIAKEFGNIWWMVDGAYGAPYRLSQASDKFKGMERAFAVTVDPHKALYTPYSNGAVLFRKAEDHALLAENIFADYLEFEREKERIGENFKKGEGHLGQKRIEGSMGAGPILSTLAVKETFGVTGLQTLFDSTLERIAYLYDRLKNQSRYLEPVHKPDLNVLCFTLKAHVRSQLGLMENDDALRDFINVTRNNLDNGKTGAGGYFFSATNLLTDEGDYIWVWRACIMNPRTTDELIHAAISRLEREIKSILRE